MTRRSTAIVSRDGPSPGLVADLARFAGKADEVVLVHDRGGPAVNGTPAKVRVLRVTPNRLVPRLGRDGLLAIDAPLVGFSTARMILAPGWMAALVVRLDSTGKTGQGGLIAPGSGLSATDRSVSLLRDSGYFPRLADHSHVEPPGENFLYRRDGLDEVASSWLQGLRKAGIHRALRDRDESLMVEGNAEGYLQGGTGLVSMSDGRSVRARRFDAHQSTGLTNRTRLAREAAGPIVHPPLVGRIANHLRSRGIDSTPCIPALPALALLAMGEATGTWSGMCQGAHPDEPAISPRASKPTDHLFRRAS